MEVRLKRNGQNKIYLKEGFQEVLPEGEIRAVVAGKVVAMCCIDTPLEEMLESLKLLVADLTLVLNGA